MGVRLMERPSFRDGVVTLVIVAALAFTTTAVVLGAKRMFAADKSAASCSVTNTVAAQPGGGIAYTQTDIICTDIAGKDVSEWIRGQFVKGTVQ